MSDLLQKGSDWLQQQRHEHMSQQAVYSRKTNSVTLNATKGKTEFEVQGGNGFNVAASMVDFLIQAEDLILNAVVTLPEVNDKITFLGKTFEVMALAGQGHYRFSDSFNKTLRIHTKEVV